MTAAQDVRHVVILGPDFAPSSLPPALRIRFFAQNLDAFGWRVTVLATDPRHYDWPVDPENEHLVPASVRVIRTSALPVRATRRVGVSDIGIRTFWPHWRALCRLVRREHVDLLFVPMPPYVPALLARLAHARFGIPYVLDYIDPWISPKFKTLPSTERTVKRTLAHALAVVAEPAVLRQVAHITGVSRGTTDGVLARSPWLHATDASDIPYGAEPADLEYLRRHPRPNPVFSRDDGFCHVSYVGVCNTDMRETLIAICDAVRAGLERSPAVFRRLRLHFVGTTYQSADPNRHLVQRIAEAAGIGSYLDELPDRLPYLTALRVLLESHGLLIVGSDAPHYTASKLFPYVMARRPILAVMREESSAGAILDELGAGTAVTFGARVRATDRIAAISKGLEELLELPAGWEPPVRWDVFERYTTRAMTARLAAAFDRALARRSPA